MLFIVRQTKTSGLLFSWAYNVWLFSTCIEKRSQVHSSRMLQNRLKSISSEHWLSFLELCKPHLAALCKRTASLLQGS